MDETDESWAEDLPDRDHALFDLARKAVLTDPELEAGWLPRWRVWSAIDVWCPVEPGAPLAEQRPAAVRAAEMSVVVKQRR